MRSELRLAGHQHAERQILNAAIGGVCAHEYTSPVDTQRDPSGRRYLECRAVRRVCQRRCRDAAADITVEGDRVATRAALMIGGDGIAADGAATGVDDGT